MHQLWQQLASTGNSCHQCCIKIRSKCSLRAENKQQTSLRYVCTTNNKLRQTELFAHERELLRVVDAVRHWCAYLHWRKFTIYTDHCQFTYIETQKTLFPKQVRWLETIVAFDFTLVPIRGKSHALADVLSRQRHPTDDDTSSNF